MRTTQAIFRAVIRAGKYDHSRREAFMCCSLRGAFVAGIITRGECQRAQGAINRYIGTAAQKCGRVLRVYLRRRGDERGTLEMWRAGAGRDFYWNWDKRPRCPKD